MQAACQGKSRGARWFPSWTWGSLCSRVAWFCVRRLPDPDSSARENHRLDPLGSSFVQVGHDETRPPGMSQQVDLLESQRRPDLAQLFDEAIDRPERLIHRTPRPAGAELVVKNDGKLPRDDLC